MVFRKVWILFFENPANADDGVNRHLSCNVLRSSWYLRMLYSENFHLTSNYKVFYKM